MYISNLPKFKRVVELVNEDAHSSRFIAAHVNLDRQLTQQWIRFIKDNPKKVKQLLSEMPPI